VTFISIERIDRRIRLELLAGNLNKDEIAEFGNTC